MLRQQPCDLGGLEQATAGDLGRVQQVAGDLRLGAPEPHAEGGREASFLRVSTSAGTLPRMMRRRMRLEASAPTRTVGARCARHQLDR